MKSKIYVDADACPVKEIIENEAKKYGIEVIMFIDTSHILKSSYSKVIVVDKGHDSADLKIINSVEKNDLVITNDYGLASVALMKGCFCLSFSGLVYTENNINELLFKRFLGSKTRRAGRRDKPIKKRNENDDESFLRALNNIIINRMLLN